MNEKKDSPEVGHTPRMETYAIRDLLAELKNLGEKSFRRHFNHPFLLVDFCPPPEYEWVDPKTMESGQTEVDEDIEPGDVFRAIAVRKTDRNAYESRVTMGRTRNNDIVVRDAKISKLHAMFIEDKSGYRLTDMGSANGTVVNGERLKKKQSVKLKSGDKIVLWRYMFTFLDLDSFLGFLRKQSRKT
jgi:hypothetical protein